MRDNSHLSHEQNVNKSTPHHNVYTYILNAIQLN